MSTKKLHSEKSETKFQINGKVRRRFSEAFKKEKVQEILEKRISIAEFCRLHQVTRTSVYKWIYKYSSLEKGTHQVVEMKSEAQKAKILNERVAILERKLGQKQLTIDYLQKVIEEASKELGYDLKKSTNQCHRSFKKRVKRSQSK
jgi:transposase-like protein